MMMLLSLLSNGAKMLVKNKKGQAMVEYGLIIALIAIVVIGAITIIGLSLGGVFNDIGNSLPAVPAAGE